MEWIGAMLPPRGPLCTLQGNLVHVPRTYLSLVTADAQADIIGGDHLSFTHFLLQVLPALTAVRVERHVRASAYGNGDGCPSALAGQLQLWPVTSAGLTPPLGPLPRPDRCFQDCPTEPQPMGEAQLPNQQPWWQRQVGPGEMGQRQAQGLPRALGSQVTGRRDYGGDAVWKPLNKS